jgi:hypothetical protein
MPAVNEVAARLSSLPRFGDVVSVTRGLEHFNEKQKNALWTRADLPSGVRKGRRFARFLPAARVRRYVADRCDTYIDSDLFSRERKEQFARPKLVFGGLAPALNVASDEDGTYLGDSLFSLALKSELSISYLVGILNSSLLNALFLRQNGLSAGSRPKRLEVAQLAALPVMVPGNAAERKLKRFVEGNAARLVHARQARNLIIDTWLETMRTMGCEVGSLGRALSGRPFPSGDVWVRRMMPGAATLLRRTRKFTSLLCRQEEGTALCRLYGVAETGDELMLAEIEFADAELAFFVATGVAARSDGRRPPMPIARLLAETGLPVREDGSIESARTFLKQAMLAIGRALNAERIPCAEPDINRLDRKVADLQVLADAEIFRLYGCTWEQAAAALNVVQAPRALSQRIETFFTRVVPESPEPPELIK